MTIEIHRKAPDGSDNIILLDNADAMVLMGREWHLKQQKCTYYAQTHAVNAQLVRSSTTMHRLIMNPPEGYQVVHLNKNGLDNRRENLRVVPNRSTSGHPGITWHKRTRKWQVRTPGPDRRFVGLYKTLDLAVAAQQAYLWSKSISTPLPVSGT